MLAGMRVAMGALWLLAKKKLDSGYIYWLIYMVLSISRV